MARQASLLVEFQVKATKEAHVFLGRPRKEGLEVVLGGDNNTHSMIRRPQPLLGSEFPQLFGSSCR